MMADSKMFMLTNDVDIEKIGHGIENWLQVKKQLYVEGMVTNEGYLVQAKQQDSWKKLVGMDSALQVQLFKAGDNQVMINVGNGSWVDKAGAATIGMIAFAPLAVTAAIGAWNQKKMPEEIFAFVSQFIMSGGQSVEISMAPNKPMADGQVACPNCQTPNAKDAKFCTGCGTKMQKECPHCHASVGLDTKFCPECGENLTPKDQQIMTCPDCQNEVPANSKFCAQCGHAFS